MVDREPPSPTPDPTAPGQSTTGLRTLWQRLLAIPTPVLFAGCLGVALMAVWRQGQLASLAAMATQLQPLFVIGVLLLYAVGPALQCVRWNALVRMVGGTPNLGAASEVFLTSVIVNYAAPIGLAVPTRTALTVRDLGLPFAASGAVVLWEALLDLGLLAIASAIWVMAGDIDVLREALPGDAGTVRIVGLVLLGGAIAIGMVLWRMPRWRLRLVRASRDLAAYPVRQPAAFGLAALSSVGFWVVQALVLAALLTAVGVAAQPILVLGVLGPPILVGMLSPVPGGAGIREALMVVVAHVEGVDGAAVLFAAVAYRAALFLMVPLLYAVVRLIRRGWRRARSSTSVVQVSTVDR